MVDIYHCFSCEKNLSTKKVVKDDEHFFWCDAKCHLAYQKKFEKEQAPLRQWSAFMSGEGSCPKEMFPLVNEQVSQAADNEPPSKSKKISETTSKSGRSCGKCGQSGHNARTCGNTTSTKTQKSRSSKRRRYICGNCGQVGHNARTCKR